MFVGWCFIYAGVEVVMGLTKRRPPVRRMTLVVSGRGWCAPADRELFPDFSDVAGLAFVSMPTIKSQVLKI